MNFYARQFKWRKGKKCLWCQTLWELANRKTYWFSAQIYVLPNFWRTLRPRNRRAAAKNEKAALTLRFPSFLKFWDLPRQRPKHDPVARLLNFLASIIQAACWGRIVFCVFIDGRSRPYVTGRLRHRFFRFERGSSATFPHDSYAHSRKYNQV